MEQRETVGFIGLGHAGWPMAESVVAGGFRVIVGDLDREKERRFVAEHPEASAATDTGFSEAGVVITMLPNGQVVREAIIDGEVAASLARGSIVVDMSSSAPAGTLELADDLAKLGLVLVDAPVSMPTPDGAWSRSLTLMVGGNDEKAIDRVMPILEAMSENIFRVGPLGAGHAAKTLNNFVSASGYVAALDALIIGSRYGLDPQTLFAVFNASTARNFSTAYPLRQEGLSRRFASGFSLGLLVKDLGITTDLADRLDLDAPLARLVRDRLAEARDELGFDADHTEAMKYWETKSGVHIPTESE
jgi:3-hydroxyisobutyrate dehydrogenase